MQNVRVYNLRKYIIEKTGKQPCRYNKIMIIEGNTGVVIRDEEGCGWDENIITDSIRVGLNDYDPNIDVVYAAPQYIRFIVLKEIIENAECEETPLKQFIEKWDYNQRMRRNFHETLESMTYAGIDVDMYLKENVST